MNAMQTRDENLTVTAQGKGSAAAATLETSVEERLLAALQNSRRAGARLIEIRIGATRIAVRDDGCGIAHPKLLLHAGQSGWNGFDNERPEGNGLYAMRRSGCTITSRTSDSNGFTVEIDPATWAGTNRAAVKKGPPGTEPGTVISFPYRETPERDDHNLRLEAQVHNLAARCARRLPVPVTINDEPAAQELPEEEGSQVRTTKIDGMRIHVRRTRHKTPDKQLDVDFYGRPIATGLPWLHVAEVATDRLLWHAIVSIDKWPERGTHREPEPAERIRRPGHPPLPAETIRTLKARVEEAIFETIRQHGNTAALGPAARAKSQAVLGEELPAGDLMLSRWTPVTAHDQEEGTEPAQLRKIPTKDPIVVPENCPAPLQQMLAHALAGNEAAEGMRRRLSWQSNLYNGDERYENTERLETLDVQITDENGTRTLDPQGGKQRIRAKRIALILTTCRGRGQDHRSYKIETDIAFIEQRRGHAPNRIGLVLLKENPPDARICVELIDRAFFTENPQLDELASQRAAFLEEAWLVVEQTTLSRPAWLAGAAGRCLEEKLAQHLGTNERIQINYQPGKVATVRLQKVGPNEENAE